RARGRAAAGRRPRLRGGADGTVPGRAVSGPHPRPFPPTETRNETTMTTTIKTQSPASSAAVQPRTGFQPIPTRIRDPRDAQGVPPLVVEPMGDAQKAQVRQTLGELGIKLAEIHRTAAEAYLSQGLYDSALPHLDAAATFAPTEIEYHNQLGFVRYVTGDDVGAIASFQRVIAGEPANADAWFNLGMVLYGQNQFAEAEGCFRR